MSITLLDASMAGLAEAILIIAMIVITLIEAAIMAIMKLNPLGKCLLDSFLVNLVSLGIGYLISQFYPIVLGGDSFMSLIVGFIVSVLVEGGLLQLLNKKKPIKQVWKTNLIMNAVTYTCFLIIFIIQADL